MSAVMHWSEDGYLRREPPHGDCNKAAITYLAGTATTDGMGEWSMDVPASLCVKLGFVTWVSMVATPSQRVEGHFHPRPAFVTTQWDPSAGLTLYVQSWDCRCEPLPEVEFGYHVAIGRLL